MADNLFVGTAGQHLVLAEFLMRGYTPAIPSVDLGNDLFVLAEPTGELWRVQVKTATATRRGNAWRAKFAVDGARLEDLEKRPQLVFVFAVCCGGRWDYLVMGQQQLLQESILHDVGSRIEGRLLLTVTFGPSSAMCSGRDWQEFRNDWRRWPVIRHG